MIDTISTLSSKQPLWPTSKPYGRILIILGMLPVCVTGRLFDQELVALQCLYQCLPVKWWFCFNPLLSSMC